MCRSAALCAVIATLGLSGTSAYDAGYDYYSGRIHGPVDASGSGSAYGDDDYGGASPVPALTPAPTATPATTTAATLATETETATTSTTTTTSSTSSTRPTSTSTTTTKSDTSTTTTTGCYEFDAGGWVDSSGDSCAIYAALKWCTVDGVYGAGWATDPSTDSFANYAVGGLDATDACCECGGGLRHNPSSTTTTSVTGTTTTASTTTETTKTTTSATETTVTGTTTTTTTKTGTTVTSTTSTSTTTTATFTSTTTTTIADADVCPTMECMLCDMGVVEEACPRMCKECAEKRPDALVCSTLHCDLCELSSVAAVCTEMCGACPTASTTTPTTTPEPNPSCASTGHLLKLLESQNIDFTLCDPGYSLKNRLPEAGCAGFYCTSAECCDPNPSCLSSSFRQHECGGTKGPLLKQPAPTFRCAGKKCSVGECCGNPSCSDGTFDASKCSHGFTIKAVLSSARCTGSECQISECCDTNPSCFDDTFRKGQCHSKTIIMDPLPRVPCTSSRCTSDECCVTNPTCSEVGPAVCKSNWSLKEVLPLEPCEGPQCTSQECCDPHPTCASLPFAAHDCEHGHRLPLRPIPAWSDEVCSTPSCSSSDCCVPVPTCASSNFDQAACGAGFKVWDALSESGCPGLTCTPEDCCEKCVDYHWTSGFEDWTSCEDLVQFNENTRPGKPVEAAMASWRGDQHTFVGINPTCERYGTCYQQYPDGNKGAACCSWGGGYYPSVVAQERLAYENGTRAVGGIMGPTTTSTTTPSKSSSSSTTTTTWGSQAKYSCNGVPDPKACETGLFSFETCSDLSIGAEVSTYCKGLCRTCITTTSTYTTPSQTSTSATTATATSSTASSTTTTINQDCLDPPSCNRFPSEFCTMESILKACPLLCGLPCTSTSTTSSTTTATASSTTVTTTTTLTATTTPTTTTTTTDDDDYIDDDNTDLLRVTKCLLNCGPYSNKPAQLWCAQACTSDERNCPGGLESSPWCSTAVSDYMKTAGDFVWKWKTFVILADTQSQIRASTNLKYCVTARVPTKACAHEVCHTKLDPSPAEATCLECASNTFLANGKCTYRLTCKGPRYEETGDKCTCRHAKEDGNVEKNCHRCHVWKSDREGAYKSQQVTGGDDNDVAKYVGCYGCSNHFYFHDGDCVSKEECSGTFGLAAYNAQTRSGYKNFCVKPFVCLNEVHQDTGESCKCKRRDNGEVGRKNLCKSCEWGLNGVEYSCTENN